jgi:thymidylate kinase
MTTFAEPQTTNAPVATADPAPRAPRRMRPARRDVFALLSTMLERFAMSGTPHAAWQGPLGAAEQWRVSTGPADLDIWCDDAAYAHLDALLTDLGAARVQHADRAGRLRHTSYALETIDGLAVIDLTRGDLAVGPVQMIPADLVRTTMSTGTWAAPRLAGAAAAADLFIRPLLRGRLVDGDRLAQARMAWAQSTTHERIALLARLELQLGRPVSDGIEDALDGATPDTSLVRRARRAMVRASLRPSNLGSTWSQRHTIIPARGKAGVLGLSTKGALVVLVGTDGSGKSTVAAEIDRRLQACGVRTTNVYMGMARGNLPGVALARKVLGVAPAGDSAPTKATAPTPTASGDLEHATVRRLASWYYAVEYGYRWWRDIRPGMKNGGVVIADRYVYDLRESPWPGSMASRVAERLMPTPHVIVLPDAPDEIIHARKPERTAAEQAAQQGRFRTLLATAGPDVAALTVDTSGLPGADPDPVAPVVSAVVASIHRQH